MLIKRKKDIFILKKGLISNTRIRWALISAEKMCSIDFTKYYTKFCLSLHDNGAKSYLFVNGTETHRFKAKDPEIVPNILCFGKVSKYFLANNMIKTGLNGCLLF